MAHDSDIHTELGATLKLDTTLLSGEQIEVRGNLCTNIEATGESLGVTELLGVLGLDSDRGAADETV